MAADAVVGFVGVALGAASTSILTYTRSDSPPGVSVRRGMISGDVNVRTSETYSRERLSLPCSPLYRTW